MTVGALSVIIVNYLRQDIPNHHRKIRSYTPYGNSDVFIAGRVPFSAVACTDVQEEQVLLSLPVTVDNVQKELAIFEGDDPMEAVLEFCRDNMPEEGAACADELIAVVQDNISPGGAREE